MARDRLKLKVVREKDIDSTLRVLTDNDYKVWRTEEVTEKVVDIELKSYFVYAEDNRAQ